MKIPKDARRIARRLFRSCFVDEVFDETAARAALEALLRDPPRHAMAVLTMFHRLARLEQQRNSALIESSAELPRETREDLEGRLRQLYRRPLTTQYAINPRLIGGMRVRVGSDVWDGSVRNRLETLKATL